jgi:hypothetical protein
VENGDGVALSADGATYITDLLKQKNAMYVVGNVTRMPGVWNENRASTSFAVMHWTLFTLNLIMLLFGLFVVGFTLYRRRASLLRTLSSAGKASYTSIREPHMLLSINSLVYFVVACMSLSERRQGIALTVLVYMYWAMSYFTISIFHVWWAKIAYRVFPLKRYKALIAFAAFNFVFTMIAIVMLLVGLYVPSLFVIHFPGRAMTHVGAPALYMLEGLVFVWFALQFLARIFDYLHSTLAIRKLQRLTLLGMVLLVGNVFSTAAFMLYIVASSVESNVLMIVLMNVSGVIAQGGAFLVPGQFEDAELNTQMEDGWTEHPGLTQLCTTDESEPVYSPTIMERVGLHSHGFDSHMPLAVLNVDDGFEVLK